MTEAKTLAKAEMAYSFIRSAAHMLSAFPYAEAAAALRQQSDMAYILDPTTARAMDDADMKRKLRLLDAAAAFVAEWNAVKTEVLQVDGSSDG